LERKIVGAEAQIWGRRGEICASGAPNDFSRSSETPNTTTHYSEKSFFAVFAKKKEFLWFLSFKSVLIPVC